MSAAEYMPVSWETIECGKCGIHFQVSSKFNNERRETGGSFYCPNGHCRVYRETDVQKLEAKLSAERDRKKWAERRLKSEQDSHRATKGHLTRQKKRVAAGVCPCCQRTFKQLARHMKAQHPGYANSSA